MEGAAREVPPSLMSTSWAPAWNSNHAIIKFQQEVGGSLQGGDPGKRLFEPSSAANWYDGIPASSEPVDHRWLVVPNHHIFGSEPLSCGSPAVAERIDAFSVTLNGDDLAGLQIESGDTLELSIDGNATIAEARQDDGIPSGVAAVDCGIPGSEGIAWLKQAEIRKRG
jgi:NADH-quinone oxidoreductase subunit G